MSGYFKNLKVLNLVHVRVLNIYYTKMWQSFRLLQRNYLGEKWQENSIYSKKIVQLLGNLRNSWFIFKYLLSTYLPMNDEQPFVYEWTNISNVIWKCSKRKYDLFLLKSQMIIHHASDKKNTRFDFMTCARDKYVYTKKM